MKRGRPSLRALMHKTILSILSESPIPHTVSSLAKESHIRLGRKVSWNTVQKYLQELVEIDKVRGIAVPHSKLKDKTGLTVYTIKK